MLLYKGSQEALNQFLICQEAQPEPEAVPTEEARVRVSLLICCVCDYWNINNTTWAVWKHILVGECVLKDTLSHFGMFPYLDRCQNNPCLRRTERKWIRVAYQHIEERPMLSNVQGIFCQASSIPKGSKWFSWFSWWSCSCCMPHYYGWNDVIRAFLLFWPLALRLICGLISSHLQELCMMHGQTWCRCSWCFKFQAICLV